MQVLLHGSALVFGSNCFYDGFDVFCCGAERGSVWYLDSVYQVVSYSPKLTKQSAIPFGQYASPIENTFPRAMPTSKSLLALPSKKCLKLYPLCEKFADGRLLLCPSFLKW